MLGADLSEQLFQHARQLELDALDPGSWGAAKTFILDSFGVAMAGHHGPFASELMATVPSWGQASDALAWGSKTRLPAAHAAMVNAYLIHNQEFDCVHERAVVHPMAVVLSSLVALGERGNWSGRDLLRGVIIAVDVATTLGLAARSSLRFFRPAQCGALGAVVAACAVENQGTAAMRNACGVLLGQLSGTMQAHREGVALLPMQIAFNARNAVIAFDLSCAGLVGPQHGLEGPFGYLELFEGKHDLAAALATLQPGLRIREVSHKPFPSGRATHGGLDAVQQLLQQTGWHGDEIESMVVDAPPLVCQLIARPAQEGMSVNYAKLCFAWCAACLLCQGRVDVASFAPSHLSHAATLSLAQRIRVVPDANPDPNALSPVRVVIQHRNGTTVQTTVNDVLGSPARPLSPSEHRLKFQRNWALRSNDLVAAEAFAAGIDRLEAESSLSPLLSLLAQ